VPTTKVTMTGPIFTGQAAAAAAEFTQAFAAELAEVARDWIKLDTQRMTRSGSDTGAAAAGVKLSGEGADWVVSGGIKRGVYAWPWLEGTSRRNKSTQFAGYHTFRRTRLRIRTQVNALAELRLQPYLARMGGE
jgi:hypothetical protein